MTSELLFEFDRSFNTQVIGTDEAGRGPAAGGVFAAAVMFEKVTEGLTKDLAILNDSKKLTAKKRESIYDIIKNNTLNKIVCVEVEEIEKINILNASLKAMNIVCSGIVKHPETLVLVDGNKLIKNFEFNQQYVIKGDSKSASIAAASILAKVTRDRYMTKLHEEFPMYNWAKNAGYLTKEHLDAIDKYGLCKYHRPSFLRKHFLKQNSGNQHLITTDSPNLNFSSAGF
ncbi:TPA: ribonuclease HII [Candidatus Gastranaerophilales bacterium HUM_8]|jgi:ribonuclease HII|nr:MAG TPA: ribonuclease HII [Candidatus Gastranaerophilales bacterium HUM_8]DAA99235.1 MAG TPA: ribonuclease HII [Candidatus Gastranaerophilales bacterium HUM_11]DAB17000.1 MAG TPA: ribonuclease HII [Candidatus Gastranaerophilales bacterium HUM_18]